MHVNISQILSKDGAVLPITLSENLENIEGYPDVVDFLTPVNIEGTITNTDGVYLLEGTGNTKAMLRCGRCLEPVEVDVYFKLNEVFSNTGSSDEEIETFSGDIINLSYSVGRGIIANIPMKVLCSDDCKGLCPICGKDLNKDDSCSCDTSNIDPRFESLRSLFKVDEEV